MVDENKQDGDVEWSEEEKYNIVGFFNLLMKIDKRYNPEKYVRRNNNGSKRVL